MEPGSQEVRPAGESLSEQLKAPVRIKYTEKSPKGKKEREIEYSGLGADFYLYAASLPGGTEAFQKKLGQGRPSGETKLATTVEHCYSSLPPELQTAIMDKARAILQQENIDPGDAHVSLFRFFQLKGPEIIAEISQGEKQEPQIPAGQRLVDEKELTALTEKAIDLGGKNLRLKQGLKQTKTDLEAAQRENIKLAQAPEDVQKLAAFIRTGGQTGRLDELITAAQQRDTIVMVHLLKTAREQLGEEQFAVLLGKASETLKTSQFIASGETVDFRNERYQIQERLGGGRFGEVFLVKVLTGEKSGQHEAWKASKLDARHLNREVFAMNDLDRLQRKENVSYTPQFIAASQLGEGGFQYSFFRMEYVSGKSLDQISREKQEPLDEPAVRKVFSQVSHLGSLIECAGLEQTGTESPITLAADFQPNRIRIVDEVNWEIKIIDWSMPFPVDQEGFINKKALPAVKREALAIIGRNMTNLLGNQEVSPEIQAVISKCTGQEPEEFPPYQSFTELYEDLNAA